MSSQVREAYKMTKPTSIDQYIATFPEETQEMLQEMRTIIRSTAPAAEETISYAIPSFKLNGTYLIYFAGYKHHIGMYPVPSTDEFEVDYAGYKTSGKGAIQFPLDKPLPVDLIKKILAYRIKETSENR